MCAEGERARLMYEASSMNSPHKLKQRKSAGGK